MSVRQTPVNHAGKAEIVIGWRRWRRHMGNSGLNGASESLKLTMGLTQVLLLQYSCESKQLGWVK